MFNIENKVETTGNTITKLSPGIYQGYIQNIEITQTKPKEDSGKVPKDMLTFTFRTKDELTHIHTIFPMKEEDRNDPKKIETFKVNVFMIPNAMFGDIVNGNPIKANNEIELFKEIINRCKEKGNFDQVQNYKDFPLSFKIVGNVYNGRVDSRIPPYGGSVVKLGDKISFSQNELAANNDYSVQLQIIKNAKDSPTGALSGEGSSDSLDKEDLPF